MRQFDTKKQKTKKRTDEIDSMVSALNQLDDELEDSDLEMDDLNSEDENGEELGGAESESDGREEMTIEEIKALEESVKPVRLVLHKASDL